MEYWFAFFCSFLMLLARKSHLKSGSVFWVGSDIDLPELRPDYYLEYNGSMPYIERVDTAISWLNQSFRNIPSILTVLIFPVLIIIALLLRH